MNSSTRESTPTKAGVHSTTANSSMTTSSNMTSDTAPTTAVTNHEPLNLTASPSTQPGDGVAGVPGGVIALLVGLLVLGVAVFALFIYLKRSGKLYRMVPFKPLVTVRSRRSSTTGSTRPLDMDMDEARQHEDHEEQDDLPKPREGEMFTIDDMDMDTVDIDSQSRGTNDEYFYDEVFGKSQFEDEVTNASMRELYLSAAEDDDMLDVDAIVSHITGDTAKRTET